MTKKILVVDDEPDILKIIIFRLKKAGYETLTAVNGLEAIDLAQKQRPDLIVMDIMMPKLDGIAAVLKLKSIDETKSIPVIMCTAVKEDEDKILARNLGVADYIRKSSQMDALEPKIERILNTLKLESIYDGLLVELKKLSDNADVKTVSKAITNPIIKELSSQDKPILLYVSKNSNRDYTFVHPLNVCLLSIKIGIRLGFSKERLENLGFMALNHDREDIKYDEELNSIVKLADIYDGLSHSPAYRHSTMPFETLKSIVNAGSFDRELVKILLEELSVYPEGSWVQLSTKEIGKVIKVYRESIFSPVVEIFIDSKNRHLEKKKIVDVSKDSSISVLKPLNEEEIKDLNLEL